MGRRQRIETDCPGRTLSGALAILLGASACIAAPAAKPTSPTPTRPQAQVHGVTLRLQRTEVERTATLQLNEAGTVPSPTRHEHSVRFEFAVTSRTPASLAAVKRGVVEAEGKLRAVDSLGKETRDIRAEVLEQEAGPLLRVTIHGLSTRATAIRMLEGALPLFPEARIVRFHVPWLKDETPLSAEAAGGAKATLRRFQLVEEDSTLWISVRPPVGLRVAPLELPGAVDARAMDIYGNLVNGGGITRIELARAGEEPEFRFFAPALRRTPSRLTLDVLCVSGPAQPIGFVIRDLQLPK